MMCQSKTCIGAKLGKARVNAYGPRSPLHTSCFYCSTPFPFPSDYAQVSQNVSVAPPKGGKSGKGGKGDGGKGGSNKDMGKGKAVVAPTPKAKATKPNTMLSTKDLLELLANRNDVSTELKEQLKAIPVASSSAATDLAAARTRNNSAKGAWTKNQKELSEAESKLNQLVEAAEDQAHRVEQLREATANALSEYKESSLAVLHATQQQQDAELALAEAIPLSYAEAVQSKPATTNTIAQSSSSNDLQPLQAIQKTVEALASSISLMQASLVTAGILFPTDITDSSAEQVQSIPPTPLNLTTLDEDADVGMEDEPSDLNGDDDGDGGEPNTKKFKISSEEGTEVGSTFGKAQLEPTKSGPYSEVGNRLSKLRSVVSNASGSIAPADDDGAS